MSVLHHSLPDLYKGSQITPDSFTLKVLALMLAETSGNFHSLCDLILKTIPLH